MKIREKKLLASGWQRGLAAYLSVDIIVPDVLVFTRINEQLLSVIS
jgi:hypothetical protein